MKYDENNVLGVYFATYKSDKLPSYYAIQGKLSDHVSLCRVGETKPFSENHITKESMASLFNKNSWFPKPSPAPPEPEYDIY